LTLLFKLSFCTLNDSFTFEISFTLLSRLCKYCRENKGDTCCCVKLHIWTSMYSSLTKIAFYLLYTWRYTFFISDHKWQCPRKTLIFVLLIKTRHWGKKYCKWVTSFLYYFNYWCTVYVLHQIKIYMYM